MPSEDKFLNSKPSVGAHYRGVQIFTMWQTEPVMQLNIAEAYSLAHELDAQVALASGLELITVRADALEVDDILWDLGKLSVKEADIGVDIDLDGNEAELCRVLMADAHTELMLRSDIRLRVGRAIV